MDDDQVKLSFKINAGPAEALSDLARHNQNSLSAELRRAVELLLSHNGAEPHRAEDES